AEAPGAGFIGRDRAVAARPRVDGLRSVRRGGSRRDFLARAPARVDEIPGAELFEQGVVGIGALRLEDDRIVVLHPAPGEQADLVRGAAGNRALGVEVFDPDDPLAAEAFCEEPGSEGREERPEVQGPRRGRGESADFPFYFFANPRTSSLTSFSISCGESTL